MGLNFYDYDGIQPKLSPPKHFSRQCILAVHLKFLNRQNQNQKALFTDSIFREGFGPYLQLACSSHSGTSEHAGLKQNDLPLFTVSIHAQGPSVLA
jgi:hypothetical protein